MTRGERWKHFMESKGWVENDVIRGRDGEILRITINSCAESGKTVGTTFTEVLIMQEYDLLCGELPSGSVVFQWDDILHVRIEAPPKKKGFF